MSATLRRTPLCELARTTFADIEKEPGALYGPAEIASAGILKSYPAIQRAIEKGRLPQPIRLPNGRPKWRGRDLLNSLS